VPTIFGNATFTGTVTRVQPGFRTSIYVNQITGGTYAPTATATLTAGVLSGIPADPGFAVGGGTFSLANVTVTGGGSVASIPRLDAPVYIQSVNDAAVLAGLQRGGAMRLTP